MDAITTKHQNNHHHNIDNHEDDKKKKMKKKSSQKGVRLSTDPQSVAARERRHRISERFKVLQSLVPGGTKMDTVSMLEEAIHYVKFLQTQIWLHQNCTNTMNNNNTCFNLQDHEHEQYHQDNYVHPSVFFDNVNTCSSSSPSTLNLHYPSSSSYSTSPTTQYDHQQQQLLNYSSSPTTTSTYFTTGMQCPPASSSLGYLEGHPAATTLPPAAYCCDHEDDDDQYQALLSHVSSSINY